jgi:hypothetical protein
MLGVVKRDEEAAEHLFVRLGDLVKTFVCVMRPALKMEN